MTLIMVLGTAWTLVSAVNKASNRTVTRQKDTADALRLAKYSLLGYIAQQALTSDVPGMFPCPESTSDAGGSSEGYASTSCSTLPAIGRFPWRTIGIEKPIDGSGEALWYAVGSDVRAAPINFSTTGALTVDGKAAVAVIIAPGAALDTASNAAFAPSPCVKRNQSSGRSSTPLNASDFVECGNATLSAFVSSRNDTWGNDRLITITAAEMQKAIEAVVAERIQLKVAPILNGNSATLPGWYQTTSFNEWGVRFFPYASSWSDPSTNDSCGDYGVTEGRLRLATGEGASSTCSSRWISGSVAKISGSGSFSFTNCIANPTANPTRMRCTFTYSRGPVLEVTVTAANIAMGFSTPPTSEEITFAVASPGTVNSRTPSIVPGVVGNGKGQLVVRFTMADRGSSSGTGRVFIPYASDSILLSTDTGSNPELAWFINNQWNRFTYYAISPAVTANPSGICTSADVTNCLTLTNAAAGTGNTNDKRIALVLSGRALAGKTQSSANLSDYFEAGNDQTSSPVDRTFERGSISTTFNDRPSVCPFQKQVNGSAVVLCD